MGYGPVINGKQMPITPWKGSWAQQEQERRLAPKPAPLVHNLQWPIGKAFNNPAIPKGRP